ncbi:MAG: hypothetical protein ACKOAD_02460 [Gammaproteobacteria bacterium]
MLKIILKTVSALGFSALVLGLTACSLATENNPQYTRAALEKESKKLPGHAKVNSAYTYKYYPS